MAVLGKQLTYGVHDSTPTRHIIVCVELLVLFTQFFALLKKITII
jgi:hypothetical protein